MAERWIVKGLLSQLRCKHRFSFINQLVGVVLSIICSSCKLALTTNFAIIQSHVKVLRLAMRCPFIVSIVSTLIIS